MVFAPVPNVHKSLEPSLTWDKFILAFNVQALVFELN